MRLETINHPRDLRKFSISAMKELAQEIRSFLINRVQETGGHLASNLGVVELILALHRVFDLEKDRLIFDVSHQSYVHKILTGRREGFSKLRQFGGLSGFTDPAESSFDPVKVGHAGTSISTALGLKTAFDLLGEEKHRTIALIGDASISNGVAFEALNHLGHLKKNVIVVLNDNQMSISKTVGAFSHYLSRFISGNFYNTLKKDLNRLLNDLPVIGTPIQQVLETFRKTIKKSLVPNFFEELGVHYIGPINGHDLEDLIRIFQNIEKISPGPTLFHVITQKGKGLAEAESNPAAFHGISGKVSTKQISFTEVFGKKMMEIAEREPRIAVITAAMTDGTGLNRFAEKYPEKYFDVGIAEEHAAAFAGSMGLAGIKPFVAIYSTFLQRSLDQLFQEASLQEGTSPVFVMDRSGLVGEDGPTHHGVFDIAYTRFLPRFVLMAPKDGNELEAMLDFTLTLRQPAAIRFPKGGFASWPLQSAPIELGKAEILQDFPNARFTLLAYGSLIGEAQKILALLPERFNLINLRFAKPLDEKTILDFARRGLPLVTLEEHSLIGGIGETVNSLLFKKGFRIPVLNLGLEDRFYPHGKREILLREAGLNAETLAERIRKFLAENPPSLLS